MKKVIKLKRQAFKKASTFSHGEYLFSEFGLSAYEKHLILDFMEWFDNVSDVRELFTSSENIYLKYNKSK